MQKPDKDNKSVSIQQFKEYLDQQQIYNELLTAEYQNKPYKYIVLRFPVAREYDEIKVYEDSNLDAILKSDFTLYRGIKKYEAIWSNKLRCIECEVQSTKVPRTSRFLLSRLASSFDICEERNNEVGKPYPSRVLLFENANIKVTIGFCTKAFAFLSYYKEGRYPDIDKQSDFFRLTLKIENVIAETEEQARNTLEKVSNSLLYQMDVLGDLLITLAPKRVSRGEQMAERLARTQRESQRERKRIQLTLNYEYDKVPMTLYWFAQNSTNSPIFTYFVLYQILEYYFPIYSSIEIKTRVRNLMKEPGFNISSESDIMKLLTIMSSNGVNNLGDEREQLDNVLRYVLTSEDVCNFIKNREYLKNYYTGKEFKKLSEQRIRFDDNAAVIEDLALRIYDIRCRIVHNKASETTKKILPVTKEEKLLRHEVEVLKYIAQKAITVNSRDMTLH